ncbi:MAG: hypothetical protein EOP48_15235 [Sphingobacteriales bacterium]|nr:MAG: hypothetical protein EOP48_15235 [Sphingobacteriales bacterium]
MQQYCHYLLHVGIKIATYLLTFATVKFSAFILASLVLWLSVMPCDDVAGFNNGAVSILATDHQDTQHANNDACSPFCTCSCCTGVNFKMQVTTDAQTPFDISLENPTHISSKVIDMSLPIWQPPQLKA